MSASGADDASLLRQTSPEAKTSPDLDVLVFARVLDRDGGADFGATRV